MIQPRHWDAAEKVASVGITLSAGSRALLAFINYFDPVYSTDKTSFWTVIAYTLGFVGTWAATNQWRKRINDGALRRAQVEVITKLIKQVNEKEQGNG